MSNELLMCNSNQYLSHKEIQCFRGTSSHINAIFPAYNEEVSIGSIVVLTRLYADKVVVVDDSSTNRTAEVARKVGAEVVAHGVNRGKAEALKTGFKTAADLDADIIVTMDSYGQHNPTDILKLVVPIVKGNTEMVDGNFCLKHSMLWWCTY